MWKFGIIKRLNITNVEMGFGKNNYYTYQEKDKKVCVVTVKTLKGT